MFFAKAPVSMLTAVALALACGCSSNLDRARGEATRDGSSAPSAAPRDAAPEAENSAWVGPAAAHPPAPAHTSSVAIGSEAGPAAAPAARHSPMQALSQMVTAQALLVSLLLAPLSKEGAESPVARVDAASPKAPTR